jgi:DNA-binding GntR family transcriptional regulator
MEEKTIPFSSIDLAGLNEKIYDFIKQRIINAYYPPGHKLNIREISAALGVSHTPVKDALFRLAGEDLIEISSRTGTYVKNITEADIHEIIQTRIIMETAAIEMVATRITDGQLRQLEDLYQRSVVLAVHQNDSETYKAFMEYDSRFHLFIIQFAGNNRLLNIYRNLNAHMQFVRFRLMNNAGGKMPTTDREHDMILQALRERDPEKAKQAIRDHLLRIDAACVAGLQQ